MCGGYKGRSGIQKGLSGEENQSAPINLRDKKPFYPYYEFIIPCTHIYMGGCEGKECAQFGRGGEI